MPLCARRFRVSFINSEKAQPSSAGFSPNQSNQRTHPALSSAASVEALWHLLPIDRRDPAIANRILLDIGTAPERTVPPKSSSEPRSGDQPVPRDPSRKTVNKPVHLIFSNPAAASENGASEVVQSPSSADKSHNRRTRTTTNIVRHELATETVSI